MTIYECDSPFCIQKTYACCWNGCWNGCRKWSRNRGWHNQRRWIIDGRRWWQLGLFWDVIEGDTVDLRTQTKVASVSRRPHDAVVHDAGGGEVFGGFHAQGTDDGSIVRLTFLTNHLANTQVHNIIEFSFLGKGAINVWIFLILSAKQSIASILRSSTGDREGCQNECLEDHIGSLSCLLLWRYWWMLCFSLQVEELNRNLEGTLEG